MSGSILSVRLCKTHTVVQVVGSLPPPSLIKCGEYLDDPTRKWGTEQEVVLLLQER